VRKFEDRILSGALHYFRVHPAQWRHRLQMLKAMGLNTVETYVAWNLHEPARGGYRFGGAPVRTPYDLTDLDGFLQAAREEGLQAIVRPGPYICAEWDNGGLPSWLTAALDRHLRTSDPAYLAEVDRWFDVLIPRIAEHQVTRGGNVVMVQVENEYGSFGSDAAYLRHLAEGLRRRGIDVPLFTSDGPEDHMLTGGAVPGLLATVNFGSRATEAFAKLAEHRPDDAPMCMEFWCGWFDHWGRPHVVRDAQDAANTLKEILGAGASVNIYMAHGGTSFGTTAGANVTGPTLESGYAPDITSYDYDAPISEAGAATPKFWAFREILQGSADLPAAPRFQPAVVLHPDRRVRLEHVLDNVTPVSAPNPPTFEELGVVHGVARYRVTIPSGRSAYPLNVNVRDRALIRGLGTVEREQPADLSVGSGEVELLVESLGRVNYGPLVGERKGLLSVRHGQQMLHGFTVQALALDGEMPAVPWDRAGDGDGPAFLRTVHDVDDVADAYVAVSDGDGYLWLNGFLLGRYRGAGPQRALYAPGPLWRTGRNELVVLHLSTGTPALRLTDSPEWVD